MDIYIFTVMIIIFCLVIVFLSKSHKKKDRNYQNADSTGDSFMYDDFSKSSSSSDAGGGE